jgi:hypothetical protein
VGVTVHVRGAVVVWCQLRQPRSRYDIDGPLLHNHLKCFRRNVQVLRGGSRPYRAPLGGGANKLRGSNQKRLIMLKVAPASSRLFERGSLTRTTRMLPQRNSTTGRPGHDEHIPTGQVHLPENPFAPSGTRRFGQALTLLNCRIILRTARLSNKSLTIKRTSLMR